MAKRRFRRKGKRIFKIKLADGKIYTILDMEPNPQTKQTSLRLRKSVGREVLIIPVMIFISLILGWFAYGYIGMFIAVLIGGFGSIFLVSQLNVASKPKTIIIPQSAIIGLDNYYQLKSGKYCFCCHTYDSDGNQVPPGADDYAIMSNRMEELEWTIGFLRDEISTLRYNLMETQKTGKELISETAAGLEKLIRATIIPTRTRETRRERRQYEPPYPPPDMPPPDVARE